VSDEFRDPSASVGARDWSRAALEDAVSRLESALRLAGLGTWMVDLRTQHATHDEATAAMLGLAAPPNGSVIELWRGALHPDDLAAASAAFRTTVGAALAAVHSDMPASDDAFRYEIELRVVRADGAVRQLALSARVLCDAHRVPERVVGVVRDVTDERAAAGEREALLARERRLRAGLERVHAMTASLASARTRDEVVRIALRAQREAAGASRATIWLFDDDGALERVGTDDAPGEAGPLVSPTTRVPLDGSTPARLAAATAEAVWVDTPDAIGARFPKLREAAHRGAWHALAAIPLVVEDRVLGAVACAWSARSARAPDDRALLATIASQCAQALDRVRGDEAERAAHAAAERERDRTLQLQAAVSALALPLSPAGVVDALLTQALEQLGAYSGSVFELSDDGSELVMLHSVGLDAEAAARYARFPIGDATPSRDVVRSRQPVFLATRDAWNATYDRHALAERSNASAALPLVADDRMLGMLTLSFAEPRDFDDADRAFFVALAQQGAQALARARLYEAERRARAEAAAANHAKMHFLAAMSHELRTPLNAISGYAQLLELGLRGPVSPQQAMDLASIQRNQRHLMALVDDVLRYAKLEAGRAVFNLAPVDVHEIVTDVVDTMTPIAASRGLTLIVIPPHDGIVWADGEKLRQIVLNLVSNAMKFTPAGGTITIATDTDDARVRVHVRDTGPGIADDQREQIFEPFVQVAPSRGGYQEGVGLGLAISRDLALGMSGELTVASTPGEGATFTIALRRPPTD
jgi:signal transduction histidine kinase